jgi:hypothetical protein
LKSLTALRKQLVQQRTAYAPLSHLRDLGLIDMLADRVKHRQPPSPSTRWRRGGWRRSPTASGARRCA